MKKLFAFVALALGVAFGLSACSKPETIRGNEYQLLDAPNNAEITITFSDTDNRYYGKVVNRYFGTYTLDGNSLTFGPTASTMMMGPTELMQAEQQYFQDLAKVQSFEASSNGLTLKLSDGKTLKYKKIASAVKE